MSSNDIKKRAERTGRSLIFVENFLSEYANQLTVMHTKYLGIIDEISITQSIGVQKRTIAMDLLTAKAIANLIQKIAEKEL